MGLWSKKGQSWLGSLELETDAAALQRDMLIEQLAELRTKLKRVDGQLKLMSDPRKGIRPGVALLKTIPGIGPRTAEALVAYIDDPSRFGSVRQAGAYFGWDPCQDASADKNRLGHITRNGPSTVRKLLVEAAWISINKSPTVKAFYDRIVGGDPNRKKIAVVATAHYLTRVATSMLKSGEMWREDPRVQKPSSAVEPVAVRSVAVESVAGALPQTPPRKPLPPRGGDSTTVNS